jgi:hypothetical protein
MESMSPFDDGHGRALFGAFRLASGRTELARWDGAQLTYAHANLVGSPTAYATFDDGHGLALFMGGVQSANGIQVDSIIRCDGASWSPLGATNGAGGVWGQVDTLAVYDDGSGPGLYAGGWTIAGAAGVTSHEVVRWDGTSWSAVGNLSWLNVKALMAFDDGSGSKLYAGGKLVERWDGTSWSVVGSELHGDVVQAFAVYDDGSGPALYAGGDFAISDHPSNFVNQVAKWDGAHWSRVLDTQGFWPVTCMQVFDDGNGVALYVSAGGYPLGLGLLGNVAKWDGHAWSSLPYSPINDIQAMTVFDDGSGSALYVGGQFGGVGRWDGHQWTHVGQPMENWDVVRALQVYDDGTGPGLYVTGSFLPNQTSIANGNIAKLVQGVWWPVGAGLNAPGHCMTVFDSGSGPDLYVGGEFTTAGRYASRSIARLHGCW